MLELFFTIIAAVLVAIVLLIAGLILALKIFQWRLKKAIGEFGETFKGLNAAVPPVRVHLTPVAEPQWSDATAVTRATGALQGVGFREIGAFAVDEVEGTTLRALMHPDDALYAAVYEHPSAGVWIDLMLAYAPDEGAVIAPGDDPYRTPASITVCNTEQGAGLDRPAEHPILRMPGATGEELYQRLLVERDRGRRARPVSADDFKPFFESAYAQIMDWRLARGFATPDEVQAVARAGGDDVDAGSAGVAAMIMAARANEQLETVLRERFMRQTNLSAARWEEVRDRLVFVHDRLSRDEVESRLSDDEDDEDIDDEDEDQDVEGDDEENDATPRSADGTALSPRRLFAELNAKLPPERQHKHLGEVTEPVPADVYESPAGEE